MRVQSRTVSGWLVTGALVLAIPYLAGSADFCEHGCGVCRDPKGCGGPEQKCDQAALDKAKADFERWYGVYKEQSEMADKLWDEAWKASDEANELFEEKLGPRGMIKDIDNDVTIHVLAEQVAKEISGEHLAEAVGESLAVVSIIKFLGDLGILDAKMLTLLKEMDGYASQASKSADAAYQSLQKARAAHERMEELAKQCKGSGSKSDKGSKDDDAWKSSAQKEAEAAQKILDSWKKVQGGYEDANGDFHDADLARQEALDIVQSQEQSNDLSRLAVVLRVSSSSSRLVAASAGDKLSPNKLQKFTKVMGRGFARLAVGAQKADNMKVELKKIGQLRGTQRAR